MKILMYQQGDAIYAGIKVDDGVIKTHLLADTVFENSHDTLSQLADILNNTDSAQIVAEDTLKLAPVVPNPGKIICVGLNYRRHAKESGMAIPELPVLFGKYSNSISAPGQDVPMSSTWQQVDYESELGVVIGKRAKNISVDEPGDLISTGTPEGVILGYPPEERVWMQPDDEYTVEIEGLGRLSNRMVETQA